jgi:hypothetical protein
MQSDLLHGNGMGFEFLARKLRPEEIVRGQFLKRLK